MMYRHQFTRNQTHGHTLPVLRRLIRTAWLGLLAVLVAMMASRATTAQTRPPVIRWERSIEMDNIALNQPFGFAYSTRAQAFYIVERGRPEGITGPAVTIGTITAYGERLGSAVLPIPPGRALDLTYDSHRGHLLIWDKGQRDLITVAERGDGTLDPGTLTRHPARQWDVKNLVGMTFDTNRGHLYLLDRVGPRLLRVVPADGGNWANATVTALEPSSSLPQLQGLAYDPTSDHLHVTVRKTAKLMELTLDGSMVAERDLAAFKLSGVGGMIFAPSADLTDDPQTHNLFFADHGYALSPAALDESEAPLQDQHVYLPLIGTSATQGADVDLSIDVGPIDIRLPLDIPETPSQHGQLVEFSLTEVAQPQVQAAAVNLAFVQTIDASQWSPPSPDSSGIAYLPNANALIVSDGEVNEMPIYTGVNVWHVTTGGSVVSTWDTGAFSDEPAGLGVNPANQHLFIGDDTGTRGVYEVDPGGDGVYATGDDAVAFLKTSTFDSKDPEGVEYAVGSGVLFTVDGVNREIYRIPLGPNGIFGGVSLGSITHFDTLNFGLDDPEGIAYNPATGRLYAIGRPASTLFEIQLNSNGTQPQSVQSHNISAANIRKPAGLAIGPSSQNPSELSIYIIARGVDNDSDPNENDGKLYEFSLGQSGGTPTNTPTPTHTPTSGPTPTPTNTPTVTPTPTNTPPVDTLTLTPVADAEVRQGAPNSNFGTTKKLNVDSPNEQSYLRFTVSGVTGTVQQATLRMFITNGSTDGPPLYLTGNNWTETGITWNNRPAPVGGVIAHINNLPADTWVEYDVTSVVTGNGTYDLVFVPDSTKGVAYSSRQGDAPPQLVLEFDIGSSSPGDPTNTPTPTPTSTPVSGSAVFVGAGDIADCSGTADEATALLLDGIPGAVFTIGDNAYPSSSSGAAFMDCYEPSWGQHKARTRPALGDAEYAQAGASGYFAYFGAAAGDPGAGYYSYDVGSWHIIVLNSNCSAIGGCDPGSPQGQWLQADLAAHPTQCSLAIFHEPLFSSRGGDEDLRDFWVPLYNAGADIVLNAHYHFYERFTPQNPDGVAEPGRGIREFMVGTGGRNLSSFDTLPPNSEVRNNQTHGVLKLTLHATGYDWEFVPVAGRTFTDSGSAPCVVP